MCLNVHSVAVFIRLFVILAITVEGDVSQRKRIIRAEKKKDESDERVVFVQTSMEHTGSTKNFALVRRGERGTTPFLVDTAEKKTGNESASEKILGLTPIITKFRLPRSQQNGYVFAVTPTAEDANDKDGLVGDVDHEDSDMLKLRYLSWLYHEDVVDVSLFDELDVFYPKSGIIHRGDIQNSKWANMMKPDDEVSTGPNFLSNGEEITRHNAESNTYLEVLRQSRYDVGEGKNWAQACWFFALKGSGVFVNVGKTISFNTYDEALELIYREFPEWKEEPDGKPAWGDGVLMKYAHEKGLDSIQYLRAPQYDGYMPELLYFGGVCKDTSVFGGCVPGLEFKTGVHAEQVCNCKDGSNAFTNCPAVAADVADRLAHQCTDALNCAGEGSR